MKLTLSILFFISALAASAQKEATEYFFKEIGMRIRVPANFSTVDSAEDKELLEGGIQMLEEANNVTLEVGDTRDLLSIQDGEIDYLNISITKFTEGYQSWKMHNQSTKKMLHQTFVHQSPQGTIDSATTHLKIDGLEFEKFHISVTLAPENTLHMVFITRLMKTWDFGYCYVYMDKEKGKQFLDMIMAAKFE